MAVFESNKSSNEIITSNTVNDEEVVASDVHRWYLFSFTAMLDFEFGCHDFSFTSKLIFIWERSLQTSSIAPPQDAACTQYHPCFGGSESKIFLLSARNPSTGREMRLENREEPSLSPYFTNSINYELKKKEPVSQQKKREIEREKEREWGKESFLDPSRTSPSLWSRITKNIDINTTC